MTGKKACNFSMCKLRHDKLAFLGFPQTQLARYLTNLKSRIFRPATMSVIKCQISFDLLFLKHVLEAYHPQKKVLLNFYLLSGSIFGMQIKMIKWAFQAFCVLQPWVLLNTRFPDLLFLKHVLEAYHQKKVLYNIYLVSGSIFGMHIKMINIL